MSDVVEDGGLGFDRVALDDDVIGDSNLVHSK